ncbi:hypothetical protein BKP42_41130 [Rhodococcus erythropolis]|uniref:hypothetical protein n=1 Tax=Rhodococcus erythropolis TaxID=1833 RepID=UPI000BB3AE64|nr:hypothetical protein [Rhodococcus erythropolis]PBI96432.1 hypothetical protein BKP42_41130 [Rhodococcus erythropolis]
MLTLTLKSYEPDGPGTGSNWLDSDGRGRGDMSVTRAEWTSLPPGDYDARDWLHPDQIEARIFARVRDLLWEPLRRIGGEVTGGTGSRVIVQLPMDYRPENYGSDEEVFTPTREALTILAEAKTRAVDEERNAIREWLVIREGAENAY